MSADNQTLLVGNLAADPELRYTPQGVPVANLRLAVNERVRTANGWEDGDTSFFDVVAWRGLAEHAAESLHKGDRTIVAGRWRTRAWQDNDGGKRTSVELHADEVGPSLRFAVTPQIVRQRDRATQEAGPTPFDDDRQAAREPAGRGMAM